VARGSVLRLVRGLAYSGDAVPYIAAVVPAARKLIEPDLLLPPELQAQACADPAASGRTA